MTATMQPLQAQWRHWILDNLRRRCTREAIISAMTAERFDTAFAQAVVSQLALDVEEEATAGGGAAGQDGVLQAYHLFAAEARSRLGLEYVPEPSRVPAGNTIRTSDRTIPVLLRLTRPEVILLADVLSEEECAALIARSSQMLKRSTVVNNDTGARDIHPDRTSEGGQFRLEEDEVITRIDRRLAEIARWPLDHGEGLQILRYPVGAEYKPHYDYFPPSCQGSAVHLASGGQRVATFIVYLNDVAEGGETIFPEIGLSVVPRRGHAVWFAYTNTRNQVDPLTLHGGAPVRAGEKWIATKWLRQHRRG